MSDSFLSDMSISESSTPNAITDSSLRFYSLLSFCKHAQYLRDTDHSRFIKFVLNGIHEDGKQAVIDPILDAIHDDANLTAVRDYDSLLGISTHIEVLGPLTVYPLARNEDVLKADVHLTYEFVSDLEDGLNLPIHKVPNICLGKWATHNMVRLFFPSLYEKGRSTTLSQDDQETFYNDGLRPAIDRLMGNAAAEWLVSYGDVMDSQRRSNGRFAFQTKTVPSDVVPQLAAEIRRQLAQRNHSMGHGMVVLHQVRGVKHGYHHEVEYPHPRTYLLEFLKENELISPISNNYESLYHQSRNVWWCDVGIEFSKDDGNCTQWRTDGHSAIVKAVCEISDSVSRRITSTGSSHYTRDISSHLPSVSGCRIAPGSRSRGPHQVRYLQMYTTDKALVYNPEKGFFSKHTTCSDALDGKKAIDYCETMYKLYRGAISDNYSVARLEVRVPLREAELMFSNLDFDAIQPALLTFDSVAWWSLRAYRCLALQWVIDWQATGDPDIRVWDSALLLTAASVWLLNSLHSTPDVGASSKDLLDAVLPHVDREGADPDILAHGKPTDDATPCGDDSDDEDDGPRRGARRPTSLTAPSYQYGLIFLNPIRVGLKYPVPRFSIDCRSIKDATFQYFFKTSRENILNVIDSCLSSLKDHPVRIGNKTRSTVTYCPPRIASPQPVLFELSRIGFELELRQVDTGSDNEDPSVDGDVGDNEDDLPYQLPPNADIDDELSFVYRQCLFDITARSPNKASHAAGAYCILNSAQRASVSEETYRNRKLSDYFEDCQWIIADERNQLWKKNFDYIFPAIDRPLPRGSQNYKQCKYYVMWRKMKARTDEQGIDMMREALFERFKTLYWFPRASSDRIWVSKVEKPVPSRSNKSKSGIYRKSSGLPLTDPSPRIVVQNVGPVW